MLTCQYPQAILLTDGMRKVYILIMDRRRFCLTIIIAVSFSIWGICPWNESSQAAEYFNSTHAGHGHTAGHEEETHHASKGYDHGCINPVSFSKEEISSCPDKFHSSIAASLTPSTLEMETRIYDVSIVQSQLISAFPLESFVHLYQLYSVYRI